MAQTGLPATFVLGIENTGLAIGYRVLNLDRTTYSAFTTTGVAESIAGSGTYSVNGGITAPDAGGYIIAGTSGTDIAEATIDPAIASSVPTVSQIWAQANVEPTSVPAANASMAAILGWLFALARNKIMQTSTQQTLRNDSDTATIATSAQGADNITYVREKWT